MLLVNASLAMMVRESSGKQSNILWPSSNGRWHNSKILARTGWHLGWPHSRNRTALGQHIAVLWQPRRHLPPSPELYGEQHSSLLVLCHQHRPSEGHGKQPNDKNYFCTYPSAFRLTYHLQPNAEYGFVVKELGCNGVGHYVLQLMNTISPIDVNLLWWTGFQYRRKALRQHVTHPFLFFVLRANISGWVKVEVMNAMAYRVNWIVKPRGRKAGNPQS